MQCELRAIKRDQEPKPINQQAKNVQRAFVIILILYLQTFGKLRRVIVNHSINILK